MGKRRSKGQVIGTDAENAFRAFASRHRLIVSKAEDDYGTDFHCHLQGLEKCGVAEIKGTLIGAFVRGTTSARGRIKLDRGDAEHLLEA